MALPKISWVKLNRLHSGVEWFHLHKPTNGAWSLAPFVDLCKCNANYRIEQIADHAVSACPIHQTRHGARSATVPDKETRCCLNTIATIL